MRSIGRSVIFVLFDYAFSSSVFHSELGGKRPMVACPVPFRGFSGWVMVKNFELSS